MDIRQEIARSIVAFKFALFVLILAVGLAVHLAELDHGPKAASLALLTASILCVDWMPNGSGRLNFIIGSTSSRVASVTLALGTGWHWLASETNDIEWFNLLIIIILTGSMSLGVLTGIILQMPLSRLIREIRLKPQLAAPVMDELSLEYQRLSTSLSSEDTNANEVLGCIIAMESQLSNLLYSLQYATENERRGLNKADVDRILAQSPLDEAASTTDNARYGHIRRLGLWVRAMRGESS